MQYPNTAEYELGTIFSGESHPIGGPYLSDSGLDRWKRPASPLIAIRCGLGTLVASIGGEAGIFDDLCIDLLTDDNRCLQLATVSCYEVTDDTGLKEPKLKVFSWDGVKDDVAHVQEVTTGDTSYWF